MELHVSHNISQFTRSLFSSVLVSGRDLGRLVPSKKQTVAISDAIATKSEDLGPVPPSVATTTQLKRADAQSPANSSVSSGQKMPSTKSTDASKQSPASSQPTTVQRKRPERIVGQVEKQKPKLISEQSDSNNADQKSGIIVANNLPPAFSQSAVTDEKGSQGGQAVNDVSGDSAWTQIQQKQLEQAMAQYPKTHPDRWTCIANAVPGKTKVRMQLPWQYIRPERLNEI